MFPVMCILSENNNREFREIPSKKKYISSVIKFRYLRASKPK